MNSVHAYKCGEFRSKKIPEAIPILVRNTVEGVRDRRERSHVVVGRGAVGPLIDESHELVQRLRDQSRNVIDRHGIETICGVSERCAAVGIAA